MTSDGDFEGGPVPGEFHGGVDCMDGSVDYFVLLGTAQEVQVSNDSATFSDKGGKSVLVLSKS